VVFDSTLSVPLPVVWVTTAVKEPPNTALVGSDDAVITGEEGVLLGVAVVVEAAPTPALLEAVIEKV